jgi:hypothetical protein
MNGPLFLDAVTVRRPRGSPSNDKTVLGGRIGPNPHSRRLVQQLIFVVEMGGPNQPLELGDLSFLRTEGQSHSIELPIMFRPSILHNFVKYNVSANDSRTR